MTIQGQSSTDTPSSLSSAEVTMTTTTTSAAATGLQGNDGTATPPVDAQLAAYSTYSGATSQGAPASYATAVTSATSYGNQPGAATSTAAAAAGAAQYSYAYGQGYGNYAGYGAYAAYGGYPGQYYQGELC